MTTIDILICVAFGLLIGCILTSIVYKQAKHSFTKHPIWTMGDVVWTAVGNEKIQVTIEKYRLAYDWMDKSERVIYTVKNSSGYTWERDEVFLWGSSN